MSREGRDHLKRLLGLNRAHLRELEIQAAKLGDLHVPSHIALQITDDDHAAPPQFAPRDYEQFVGRHKELAEVRRLLGPRSRAFVITADGIGGIGKSALALEAAYSFCDGYSIVPEAERFEATASTRRRFSTFTVSEVPSSRRAYMAL